MIFLSAGIPDPARGGNEYPAADLLAVREVIKALAMVIIPETQLVWGGHPAITPMIRVILDRLDKKVEDHVTLYQSAFFQNVFPPEAKTFEKLIITPAGADRDGSLAIMRQQMIGSHAFKAGIFVAGMAGVIDEYALFRKLHPGALVLPMVTTGGAAERLFEQLDGLFKKTALQKRAYISMFQELREQLIP